MSNQPLREPVARVHPAAPDPRNPQPRPAAAGRRSRWNPARQRIFLAALLDSGNVTQAARAAGMSRASAYRLRVRLAGTPFDSAWDRVLMLHARTMVDPFEAKLDPNARVPASATRTI